MSIGRYIAIYIYNIYIYTCIYVCDQKKIESYFNDRLTFSNIRGRTSRRIYRLALPLLSPEMLSSSSKSRIVLFNVYLAIFNDTITRTNASVSIIIGTSLGSKSTIPSPFTDKQNRCKLGI